MKTNSDFDKYVNSLNDITNQENRAELESFYTLHSAVLQFFKAIDKTVQDLLKKSNVGEIITKQLVSVLPTLTKLKNEISKLDASTFATGYKTKLNQAVTNIKNKMTLSDANDTAQEFFNLLKENKAIFDTEQKKAAERKAQAERARKEQKEITEAFNWGHHYYNAKNYIEAAKWYLIPANKGNFQAQNDLGNTYHAMQNYSEAIKWYWLSAQQGYAWGQYNLGTTYHTCLGVQNHAEAFKWYWLAAQQGHNISKEHLGTLYNNLGVLYADGKGVAQNYNEAAKWYQMAIQQGSRQAKENLKILKRQNKKSGCFVATACYGNYNAPEVLILRAYRDERLLTNWLGTVFVKFYYFVSPPLAKQIEKSEKVKKFIRKYFLIPIIKRVNKNTN